MLFRIATLILVAAAAVSAQDSNPAQTGSLTPNAPVAAKPRAVVTEIAGPNGTVGAILTPDSFSYAIATRTPEGGIQVDCVTGDLNAERRVLGPLPNSKEAPKAKTASDEKK